MVLKGSYTHIDEAHGLLFWLTVVSFQGFVIDMMKVVYNRECFEVCSHFKKRPVYILIGPDC
jgi:hypothetical protein